MQAELNGTRLEFGFQETSKPLTARPENASQQFIFPPMLGNGGINPGVYGTTGQMDDMSELNIFRPQLQQGFTGGNNNDEDISASNRPGTNLYANGYYGGTQNNNQNNPTNRQHRTANPFLRVDANYGILDDFLQGGYNLADTFDVGATSDENLVPIPDASPARSQGNRAQDLFLPRTHGDASDDDDSAHSDDDKHNKKGDDDNNNDSGDDKDEDDTYVPKETQHEKYDMIESKYY